MMNELEIFLSKEYDTSMLNLHSNNLLRRKYIRDNFLKKELLKYLIEELDYSCNYISNNIFLKKGYKVDVTTIINVCKEYDIKTKTIKETSNSNFVRDRYKETCKLKYGSENSLSKNTKPYLKRNETVKFKYGVNNVFQLENVKNKLKQTMIEKYGITTPCLLPNYKGNAGRTSKIHITINNYLIEKNINFISEAKNKFLKFNDFLLKEYSPIVDILIEDSKLVIEVYGDRWHANPKIYKENDLIYTWKGEIQAKKIWEFDLLRKKQIESFGYEVIEIWEMDILKNLKKVKETIDEKIFKN